MTKPARIFLSSPHIGPNELELVKEAFATNWIAPLGPHVDKFEAEICVILNSPSIAQEATEQTEGCRWLGFLGFVCFLLCNGSDLGFASHRPRFDSCENSARITLQVA